MKQLTFFKSLLNKIKIFRSESFEEKYLNDVAYESNIFVELCEYRKVNTIRDYITKKAFLDVSYNDDAAFKAACKKLNIDIIKFFIFELKLEKTKEIEIFLNQGASTQARNLFNLRKFNLKFSSDLPIATTNLNINQ